MVWTDTLQMCILCIGYLAMMIGGLIAIGGFGEMWSKSERGGRIDFPSDKYVNTLSAGIDFRRLNLTSVDVRFGRLKSIPALEEKTIIITAVNP